MRNITAVTRLFVGIELFAACLVAFSGAALYAQITKKPLANTASTVTGTTTSTVTAEDIKLRNGILHVVQKEADYPASQSDASRQNISYDDTSITIDGATYNLAQIEASISKIYPQLTEIISYIIKDPTDTYNYNVNDVLATLTAFHGYTNGQVGVNDPMTRAQTASIVSRVFGLRRTSTNTVFSDVNANDVHAQNINALFEHGITNGCATTPLRFCPSGTVTRRQFATLFGKAAQQSGKLDNIAGIRIRQFGDVTQGSLGSDQITLLATLNILKGCNGSEVNFCPDQALTRGEAARIVTRYFNFIANNS